MRELRKEVDRLALIFKSCGLAARSYHAGMRKKERFEVQSQFMSGELSLVVATVAFGLGVDHPNIVLVCHVGMPGSISGYVQEIGRAGRAGQQAWSIVFYRPSDRTHLLALKQGASRQTPRGAVDHGLASISSLCALTSGCRRQAVLRHFGVARRNYG